ncbi:hypothetical protein SAMN05421823_112197 [Catalinimonas alkaloidigena]|uniref:Uncharacterized protein n=1 Tax=Catalinimonas alkaloidigena TaxID=1075417 RepID=A0A1G9SKH4_9BACT|nr:hypothetical protein [Catalinimonas alkaloidigena]SDM36013.1 hypothetical protein SAMN05421823_112197 [Catalinimonas alkaloidigena]
MKIAYLIVGLLVGGLLGFALTDLLNQNNSPSNSDSIPPAKSDAPLVTATWQWPDSLDAVQAAPESHNIVYEDSTVRILQVVLEANATEPVHTHKWKSIMWFTQATPMTYYRCSLKNNEYLLADSIAIAQMPQEALNQGDFIDAEAPHAIKNLSNENGIAYRIEFKKEFAR